MSEHSHLINDYLCKNSMIRNSGFFAVSEDECDQFLHKLVPFERPDMYAELAKKIIILEHFEFDASRQTRKGMKGKAEESRLKKRIKETPCDGRIHVEGIGYDISFQDWQNNFEQSFQNHYDRIDTYKNNVREATGNNGKEILTGFLVEHPFSPIVLVDKRLEELPYCVTVQFAEVIQNSPNLDFVLFCGYLNGMPQVWYFDKVALSKICDNLIDLRSENVVLSHLNKNEVVLHGGFQITREDIENA